MKALVTGAAGQLGVEMPGQLVAAGFDVAVATRTALDLADPDSIRAGVEAAAPDVVVNCAAYNAVDQAEDDLEGAMAVNAEGVGVLAEACAAGGAHVIHVSTDYVFSGDKGTPYDETDGPAPRSNYGRSKLAGEEAVQAVGGRWTIARTAWVFGTIGRSLVELILDRALAGEPLRMVDDQRGSPTHAGDLAAALASMAAARVEGLYHVTNAGTCSPFELTALVLECAGVADATVDRVNIADLGRPAPRPPDSTMVSVRLEDAGIEPLRPLSDAVQDRVKELLALRGDR